MRRFGVHRFGVAGPAVSAWVCATVLLAGCASPGGPSVPATSNPSTATTTGAQATGAPTTGTSATGSATTGTPAPSASSASGWKSFTTTDGTLMFDLPAAWTIKDPAGEVAEGGGAFVEVFNPAGKPMATLRTNMATGSTCTERYPYSVLDAQPLPALAQAGSTPRFIFESRMYPAATDPMLMNVFGYGIVTGQEPTGDKGCPIFHFFTWPPNAAMFAGTYNPFDTTPGNEPHVDTPEAYKETAEYKDIKKMITSLRPAGK